MKPVQVRVKSFYGNYVIFTGDTPFPRLFKTLAEAKEVAARIHETHNGTEFKLKSL